ncbi:MAG: hypothetical protein U1F87_13080 [Kiritimatiellia bacterium]
MKLTPAFTRFASDFYGTPGLASPGVMSLAGQPLGGWGQYSLSPTMTSWNAHLFYLHWRYTMDEAFLRDQAYPWCSAAGNVSARCSSRTRAGTSSCSAPVRPRSSTTARAPG